MITLGAPLMTSTGYGSKDVEKVFDRARELSLQLGDTTQLFAAQHGLFRVHWNHAHLAQAHETAQALLRLAEGTHNLGQLLAAHCALASTHYVLGDFAGALAQAQQGVTLYSSGAYPSQYFVYGSDAVTDLLARAGWSQWALGYPDQAQETARQLVAHAERLANPLILALAYGHSAMVYALCRNVPEVGRLASAAVKIATEHNDPAALADGVIRHGLAISWLGQAEEGIAEMRRGMETLQAMGIIAYLPGPLIRLSQAYSQAGHHEDALRAADEALGLVASSGIRSNESDIWRFKGELLLRQGSMAEAEACLQRALDIARSQSAKSWELRAATSMARLWQQQGKRDEARALLQSVYGWFTEGFDTADLQDARALLDDLA